MEAKKFKIFEIGNGLNSIKMPAEYCADEDDDEEEDSTLLFIPGKEDAFIRITVMSVEDEDAAKNVMQEFVVQKGREEGCPIIKASDKSYFFRRETEEEDGEELIFNIFEVGYRRHYIAIGVITIPEFLDTEDFKQIMKDISGAISTITEIPEDEISLFELRDNDFYSMRDQMAEILDVEEIEIDKYHQSGSTAGMLQKIFDEEKYGPKDAYELESLGIALGDYLRCKYPEYHWVIAREGDDRNLALQYQDTTVVLFPVLIIFQKIENGQKVAVEKLIEDIITEINGAIGRGDIKKRNNP